MTSISRVFVFPPLFLIALGLAGSPAEAQTPPKKSGSQAAPAQTKPAVKPVQEEEEIPPAAPGALFPAVVARVNGKAILGRDLEQRIQSELAPIGNPKWTDLREDYRRELISVSLGSLIGTELVYQKAVGSGIKVTEVEVKAEFDRFAKGFASDAQMNMALASRGMDRTSLRKDLEKTLTVEKYVDEHVAKKITVTPSETAKYYKEHTDEFRFPEMVRTSHILIMIPEGASPDQERVSKQLADSVLARVKKGEDFAKLAREYSTDGTASEGGDLGFTPRGQLVQEYEDVAFSMPVGSVSDLVRTQFGYHIIKVTDKKRAGLATLPEVEKELTDFLKNQKTEEELNKLIDQLRNEATIESFITASAVQGANAAVNRP